MDYVLIDYGLIPSIRERSDVKNVHPDNPAPY